MLLYLCFVVGRELLRTVEVGTLYRKRQWGSWLAARLVAMSQLQISVQLHTTVIPSVSGQASGHVTTTDTSPTSNYSGPSCERPG